MCKKKAAYTTIQQHNTRNWIPAISCKRFGRTRLFAYLNKHKQQQQHTIDARRNKYTIQSNWWLKFLLHSLFLLCSLSHSLTLRQCIQNMCSCVNDGILFSFFFVLCLIYPYRTIFIAPLKASWITHCLSLLHTCSIGFWTFIHSIKRFDAFA